ncbi:surfactant protein C-like isoform X2 [Mixophyes fleayi]|uniref:surfactant protein C-like isoform X2 n=1 Tax=Mixophyes fleayi TaxID=3061075 RepID=UPI003F4E42A5
MDQKCTDRSRLVLPLSSASPRKTWPIVVLTLLAVVIVGATLLGVYMTQKHTEAVVEMAFYDQNGEKVHQTVMVDNIKNVATFYVHTNNESTTVLYDYNNNIIGVRPMSIHKCYIAGMKGSKVPTMSGILKSIKHFQKQNITSDGELSYNLQEGDKADRSKLGVFINILCSDLPIYWATQSNSPHQRWKVSFKFKIFKLKAELTIKS